MFERGGIMYTITHKLTKEVLWEGQGFYNAVEYMETNLPCHVDMYEIHCTWI